MLRVISIATVIVLDVPTSVFQFMPVFMISLYLPFSISYKHNILLAVKSGKLTPTA
jgi:hypothetical protein